MWLGQSLGQPIVWSFSNFFWSTKKKIVQSQRIFGQSLGIFGTPKRNLVDQKKIWLTKKSFGIPKRNLVDQKFPETDQKFPETGQFFVWSTKENEKKTGQLVDQETDQATWTGLMSFGHLF